MSETALAAFASQPAGLSRAHARRNRLSPLEALERGFALFRSTFAREAWRYYIGAAPLVFCFIPIWVANGQIRISDGALLTEAALLAGGCPRPVGVVGRDVLPMRVRAVGAPGSNTRRGGATTQT